MAEQAYKREQVPLKKAATAYVLLVNGSGGSSFEHDVAFNALSESVFPSDAGNMPSDERPDPHAINDLLDVIIEREEAAIEAAEAEQQAQVEAVEAKAKAKSKA